MNQVPQQQQTWVEYSLEEAALEKAVIDASGSEFLKLEVGKTIIRILPPKMTWRHKSPFVQVQSHYIKIAGMEKAASFNCPRMMARRPCPACNEFERLRTTGNPADKEQAWEMRARLRVFANVINRSTPELGPQTMAFGKQVHEKLVGLRADTTAGGDFTHPFKGFDLVIERTGTGKNDTEYEVRAARDLTPLGDLDWITLQKDIETLAVVDSDEEIYKKLSGIPTIVAPRMTTSARPAGSLMPAGRAEISARTAQDDMMSPEVTSRTQR